MTAGSCSATIRQERERVAASLHLAPFTILMYSAMASYYAVSVLRSVLRVELSYMYEYQL